MPRLGLSAKWRAYAHPCSFRCRSFLNTVATVLLPSSSISLKRVHCTVTFFFMKSASIIKSLVYDLISLHSFLNLHQHSPLYSSFVVVLLLQKFDVNSTTNVAFNIRKICRIGFYYHNHVNFFVNRFNLMLSTIFQHDAFLVSIMIFLF